MSSRGIVLLTAWALAGCVSAGTVVLRSDPSEAEVYLIDPGTGQNSLIGKTPLTFRKDLPEARASEVLQLRINKEGYEAKHAAIAALSGDTTYVDVKLSGVLANNENMRKAFELNRVLFAEANRLAAARRFTEALARIEKILETDSRSSEAYAAKGSLLYLMRDYDGAKTAWMKSLELNPASDSVRAALIDLNVGQASRSPANEEGKP